MTMVRLWGITRGGATVVKSVTNYTILIIQLYNTIGQGSGHRSCLAEKDLASEE